jgi:hypothetical protein
MCFGLIQIGARFVYQFLSFRDGRCTYGLDFAFGYDPAPNKSPNRWAQPGAISGHAARDCAN